MFRANASDGPSGTCSLGTFHRISLKSFNPESIHTPNSPDATVTTDTTNSTAEPALQAKTDTTTWTEPTLATTCATVLLTTMSAAMLLLSGWGALWWIAALADGAFSLLHFTVFALSGVAGFALMGLAERDSADD